MKSLQFELKPLPYGYGALEPFIDEKTMIVHHDRHLAAYVDNLNKALKGRSELQDMTLLELLRDIDQLDPNIQTAVLNNAGGVYNHNFFFENMAPHGSTQLHGRVKDAIIGTFGSFDNFKESFSNYAMSRFGSGYAWLGLNRSARLEIISTPNQIVPQNDGIRPILTIDVWEHAYYLKHLNKRADYIKDWFSVINWDFVEERFTSILN
jgi:superoxide dismutase [Mn] 2